jgi:hypothetical protein
MGCIGRSRKLIGVLISILIRNKEKVRYAMDIAWST